MIAATPLLGWSLIGRAKFLVSYAAYRHSDGSYGVAGINTNNDAPLSNTLMFNTAIPERAHDLTLSPDSNHLVCMARRPGRTLLVINASNGKILTRQEATKGRHFYGHACFSNDGRYLFTTENAFDEARGVIGVRDVNRDYKQVAEWDAHGIGPHQINLSANGDFVIVAIGGIQTHPASGREKLNLETMQSALVYLDAGNGRLIAKYALPEPQRSLSIRHVAVAKDGLVGMAFQEQDNSSRQNTNQLMPLVGFHRLGEPIQTLTANEAVQYQMRGYCASIAADATGRWFAVTSPRGSLVTLWDARTQHCTRTVKMSDCSGVAATGQVAEFIVTNGRGKMLRINAETGALNFIKSNNQALAWDNHLTSL